MFAGQQLPSQARRNVSFGVSALVHSAVVIMCCWRPEPVLIQPTLRAQGDHGASIVLYFAPSAQQQMLVAEPAKPKPARLYLPRRAKQPYNAKFTDQPGAPAHNVDAQVSSTAPGTKEGTDPVGFDSGADVRPAIETSLVDPPVLKSEIPSGVEGDVIVEVTIDEQGNVIATRLLKGLGHGIDEKVIATIRNNWHYRPATRDGVPIPSKYDARFHYRG